jgi:hypothetical protein
MIYGVINFQQIKIKNNKLKNKKLKLLIQNHLIFLMLLEIIKKLIQL